MYTHSLEEGDRLRVSSHLNVVEPEQKDSNMTRKPLTNSLSDMSIHDRHIGILIIIATRTRGRDKSVVRRQCIVNMYELGIPRTLDGQSSNYSDMSTIVFFCHLY